MKQIYLCRHGETEWSLSGQHTGVTDIPLTEKGRGEAFRLKDRLKKVSFEKVFTSPRQRAAMTCELAGFHPAIEPDAAEWDYGKYEGLTTEEIHRMDPSWNLFKDGAPGGESLDQVSARADRFLKKLSSYKGNVAVFSHGHFLRVLAARFLGLEVSQAKLFFLAVASVSILSFEKGQPVIILWNQTDPTD